MGIDDLLLVGRVARAHGLRGQVIVNPETDFAEQRFAAGAVLLIGPGSGPIARRLLSVRFHQGRPVIALEGVESMNDAEALAGAEIWIAASSAGPLPEGTFYRHDLVGCEVQAGQGRVIGTVTAVDGPLERSRLIVQTGRGEVLVPLVADICRTIDIAAKQIVIEPPEGLLELNETRRGRS